MKLESLAAALAILTHAGCAGTDAPPTDAAAYHHDGTSDTSTTLDASTAIDGAAFVDGGSEDASADAGASTMGTATLRPDLRCEPDSSGLPGSRCSVLTVQCPAIADMDVELRASPDSDGPLVGVVVLGSGGNGTRWSNGYRSLARALSSDRFRVIERRWRSERAAGWLEGGMSAGACRYATLVRWIAENETPSGAPLCVSGNSGGAGEIGTALTRQDLDTVVDLAVMTSGPMARVDYACGANAEWAPLCEPLVADHTWTCDRADATAPSCAPLGPERALFDDAYLPITSACSDPTAEHLAVLAATSPIPPGDRPDLSNDVRILLGGSDCSLAPAQGLYFASVATSRGRAIPVDVIVGAPHELPGSDAGEAALLAVLREGCVP